MPSAHLQMKVRLSTERERSYKGELKTEAFFEENERQVFQRSLTVFLNLVQSHCRLVISCLR